MRVHPGHWAFLLHRVSGVLLALFLPGHFIALGAALEGEVAMDAFLAWTQQPLVKFAEWGVVLLLAAHLTGGLRILALEFLPWREGHKTLAALAAGASLAVSLAFALALTR